MSTLCPLARSNIGRIARRTCGNGPAVVRTEISAEFAAVLASTILKPQAATNPINLRMDHPAPVIAFAAIVSVARLKIRLHGHSGFQFSTKATSARRAGVRGHTHFFALTPMWSAFRGLALP